MNYLITGATGDIGSRVVERLLRRGDRPRIFVRDVEKAQIRFGNRVDILAGDLADGESLLAALRGIDVLFLVNSGPKLASLDEAAANAAKIADVSYLVKLSSMDSRQDVGTGVWHAWGEAAIRVSGIVFTFVHPAGFMSNALGWAASIKAEKVVRAPTGDGKIAFIHPDDIAAVVTAALTTRNYAGESLPISGPETLSCAEMTAMIGAAIGTPLQFHSISDDQERRQMIEIGDPPEIIEAHILIYRAIREGRLAIVNDNVSRVVGRRPIAFNRWVQDNAAAFRS